MRERAVRGWGAPKSIRLALVVGLCVFQTILTRGDTELDNRILDLAAGSRLGVDPSDELEALLAALKEVR
jgi:hypothetical protein